MVVVKQKGRLFCSCRMNFYFFTKIVKGIPKIGVKMIRIAVKVHGPVIFNFGDNAARIGTIMGTGSVKMLGWHNFKKPLIIGDVLFTNMCYSNDRLEVINLFSSLL